MMSEIPFLNIADNNCWIVYLMPFETADRTKYDLVNNFQQKCVDDKIFGMGWGIPCFEYGTKMTEENVSVYIKKYNDQGWSVSDAAVNDYKKIRKGDYVITRLKNSHYYVGRVSSEGAMYTYKENDQVYGYFSWGCKVEEWVDYANEGLIPSEIAGRFSQRIHPTIQRIDSYRQRLLVIAMFENRVNEKKYIVPKLRIGGNNFISSLTYSQLEDLVALYIADKHAADGYKILPSSCKISQQKYEFRFVANNRAPITCQVKNKEPIKIVNYVKEKSYEHIYIFSGKWSEEEVAKERAMYKDYPHIYIIAPSELYETLMRNNIFENDFYDFCNEPVSARELPLDGYKNVDNPNGEKECSINDGFACFIKKDGFYYSAEFGALILSWHILEDRILEKKYIDQVKKDINS